MSWTFYKLLLALFITLLISGACSKDSSEEFGGGGSTAATATNFKVVSTIPEDNATKVAVNASFVISFSNDVKNSSVSESNFSLSSNGTAVSVTISLSKKIVVLLPSSSLKNGTPHSDHCCTALEIPTAPEDVALHAPRVS